MSKLRIFFYKYRIKFIRKSSLFDGDDEIFKRSLASTKKYAEYGCGFSTIWVAKNTKAEIHCIDSSQEWIDFCLENMQENRAKLQWIDCGAITKWGRPIGFEKRHNFYSYAESIWRNGARPDTVLIDGRFRVLCFLVSLKYASENTKIIFDDYINRPHYHIIEELVSRHEVCGRQCLFVVPSKESINSRLLDNLIEKFEYVMD